MGIVIRTLVRGLAAVALMAAPAVAQMDHSAHGAMAHNTLTGAEKKAGWSLLFDGQTLQGWRLYGGAPITSGWKVIDGTITRAERGGRDIITEQQFGDFELSLDWRLQPEGPAGNSGIFYRAPETQTAIYWGAPEMQILDDARHPDGRSELTSSGANYALDGVPHGAAKPVGEWNTVRIVAKGATVEHWLNGKKVVEYEMWSPKWEAAVAASKFKDYPQYGRAKAGHIGLQEHGSYVAFRNIKIRELK
jgi:hypothetical protein